MTEILLKAQHIKKYFPVREGVLLRHTGDVKAVDDVSIALREGETFGLVGESGCGKSTLARILIRLYEPTAGEIFFEGENFTRIQGEKLRGLRRDIQMIFQDPLASLDPRKTVSEILTQPYKIHNIGSTKERKIWVEELLETVGLKTMHLNRYPHEFSGGQRQRISVARALTLKPRLIIGDEPVSALDVSIQAQILNLMSNLQEKFHLTYLLISHDLGVIDHMCNRIAVIYLGKIIETAGRDALFENPKHPYTQALLDSVPRFANGKRIKRKSLKGEVPGPINPPKGCTFHPRCPHKMDICTTSVPQATTPPGCHADHHVNCFLYAENQKEEDI